MSDVATATLTRLKQVAAKGKDGKPSLEPDPEGVFKVQFNPTTLKISRSNNIDKGGATTNTQKRVMPSVQSATLSFDLEFDTAEGDEDGNPKDVRVLTRIVRQFAEPTEDKPKEPPPAVEFVWGTFRFKGIVTQLTEELDYFSPEGLPLRAKVSVTITEQNPKWEASKLVPGSRTTTPPSGGRSSTSAGGAAAPSPVPGHGPGTNPTSNPALTALAHAGESVQQLLTRLDADPATWRSAMAGLDSPLSLAAGTQVQLGASVSASAGIGADGGFTASAAVNDLAQARAALGLSGIGSLGRGAAAEAGAGFVLAEAGGVGTASARVDVDAVASAQAGARASFAVPAVGAGASGGASAAAMASADPRALSYGRGIPLRARAGGDAAATQGR
ncbi:MAG: hypothetical protein QM779_01490 [Propionicimonas sp.]|uniref:CIS tube protein n=1 Tax=Propionicimonas sp. TaxID=1955623 RepID=UPI003D098F3F